MVEHIFHRYASMAHPSPTEVARSWRREGRVFPFFTADVDERRVRWVDAHCTRDEALAGYVLHADMVRRILTDVAYLGWRVCKGEVAIGEDGQPKACHEPLIEADLFWWCYDVLSQERPVWAPPRPASTVRSDSRYRPRQARSRPDGAVPFVASGRIRCVVHGTRYAPARKTTGTMELQCGSNARKIVEQGQDCPVVIASTVEQTICSAFVEHLAIDERDVRNLARLAHEYQTRQGSALAQLQRQAGEQQALYERAKRRALLIDVDDMAQEFLAEASKAWRAARDLEQRIAECRDSTLPSIQAWRAAERAAALAERIRLTFLEWPRQYQEPVIALALAEALLGHVSQKVLGLWMHWHGGMESCREIVRSHGQRLEWTTDEEAALRAWYGELTWEALCTMLPSRTRQSIEKYASRMGLTRQQGRATRAVAPVVVVGPPVRNTMATYGFPLGAQTNQLSARTT